MFYSKTAHQSGASGFFFDDDKNAPSDVIEVSHDDFGIAVNLPVGSTYDFDGTGKLIVTDAPAPTAADLLAQAKQVQSASIAASCAVAIVAGFTSTALGKPYLYPSKQTDQSNLSANVMSSLLPGNAKDWTTPQMCCDASGEWAARSHGAAQIQQVGVDGKAAIQACLTKKRGLQDAIEAATDVSAVEAIRW